MGLTQSPSKLDFCESAHTLRTDPPASIQTSVQLKGNPQVCWKLSELRRGGKTRHGSLGRAVLITRDCPGSMMGNKWSVVSQHHEPSEAVASAQSPGGGAWRRVTASTEEPAVINGQRRRFAKTADDIIMWNL